MQLKSFFALGGAIEHVLVLLLIAHLSQQGLEVLLGLRVQQAADFAVGEEERHEHVGHFFGL